MNSRNVQAIKKFLEARNIKRSQQSSNYNSYSTDESAIDAAADYSLHVAKSYLNHFYRTTSISTERAFLRLARERISAQCSFCRRWAPSGSP